MRITLFLTLVLTVTVLAKKKKSEKKSLFDSKTLNCLVCRSLVDEIEAKINSVDPAKKVEVGTFRLNGDGTQNRKLVKRNFFEKNACIYKFVFRFPTPDHRNIYWKLLRVFVKGLKTMLRPSTKPVENQPSSD